MKFNISNNNNLKNLFARILNEYLDFAEIFFKINIRSLSPHRDADYAINLKKKNRLLGLFIVYPKKNWGCFANILMKISRIILYNRRDYSRKHLFFLR